MAVYGGVGISLSLGGQGTNNFSLQAGEVVNLPPGVVNYFHGPYTTAQVYDPIQTAWRPVGSDGTGFGQVNVDGINYRLANQTGCAIGALLTNAGSGYTSAPTVAFSAGGAKAFAIVGGAISTTVTVTNSGTNYTYPPQVVIAAPPIPGVQATGYATLSSGTVSSITITNQGAGYNAPPFVALINDSRDTTGQNATAVATLTGSQTVTAVIVTDHGTAVTSIPTISFSGGGGSSAAATAIMNWTVTNYAVSFAGAGFAGAYEVTALGTGIPTTATAYTNPSTQAGLLRFRPPSIIAALSAGGFTATGTTVLDGGCIGGVASNINVMIRSNQPPVTAPTTAATLTLAVGGTNDFAFYMKG